MTVFRSVALSAYALMVASIIALFGGVVHDDVRPLVPSVTATLSKLLLCGSGVWVMNHKHFLLI